MNTKEARKKGYIIHKMPDGRFYTDEMVGCYRTRKELFTELEKLLEFIKNKKD